MEPQASGLVTAGFAVMAAALWAVWVALVQRAMGRGAVAAAVGLAWIALSAGVSSTGVLARFDARPPPLMGLMVAVLAVSLTVGLSRVGRALAALPAFVLVGLQSFRLPLELLMHQAAQEGVMPMQMSYSGSNFDVVTGTLAIPVAWLAWQGKAPRALLWLFNAVGLVLLFNILGVALASTPIFHAFGDDAAHLNTFIAYVPFVWLPTVMVATALCGHVVLTRHLLSVQALKADAAAATQLGHGSC